MRKFAAITLVLAAIASPALATTDQELIATYRKNIEQLESQINGWMKERTVRCPKQQAPPKKRHAIRHSTRSSLVIAPSRA